MRDDAEDLATRIAASRAETAALSARYAESLDPAVDWATIARVVRDAGVSKDRLCLELSCSWSTYTRWMAGQTAPGPRSRIAVRDLLVSLVREVEADLRRAPPT